MLSQETIREGTETLQNSSRETLLDGKKLELLLDLERHLEQSQCLELVMKKVRTNRVDKVLEKLDKTEKLLTTLESQEKFLFDLYQTNNFKRLVKKLTENEETVDKMDDQLHQLNELMGCNNPHNSLLKLKRMLEGKTTETNFDPLDGLIKAKKMVESNSELETTNDYWEDLLDSGKVVDLVRLGKLLIKRKRSRFGKSTFNLEDLESCCFHLPT